MIRDFSRFPVSFLQRGLTSAFCMREALSTVAPLVQLMPSLELRGHKGLQRSLFDCGITPKLTAHRSGTNNRSAAALAEKYFLPAIRTPREALTTKALRLYKLSMI